MLVVHQYFEEEWDEDKEEYIPDYTNPDGEAYQYFTASCRVSYRGYISDLINKGPKGKGFAKKLLAGVCEHADMTGRTLYLDAYPYATKDLSRPQLVKMYHKFGFRVKRTNREGWVAMERQPVLRLAA